jgi:hypothetical protein
MKCLIISSKKVRFFSKEIMRHLIFSREIIRHLFVSDEIMWHLLFSEEITFAGLIGKRASLCLQKKMKRLIIDVGKNSIFS